MYKQMILAICFAAASLFPISQANATPSSSISLSSTIVEKATNMDLLNLIENLSDSQLENAIGYLDSKGMTNSAKQLLVMLGNCADCEYHAQAAGNQAFQKSYAETQNLTTAAGEGHLAYVRTLTACHMVCDDPASLLGPG